MPSVHSTELGRAAEGFLECVEQGRYKPDEELSCFILFPHTDFIDMS